MGGKIVPISINVDGLLEHRFREHWKITKGAEKQQFQQVVYHLENGIPQGYETTVN